MSQPKLKGKDVLPLKTWSGKGKEISPEKIWRKEMSFLHISLCYKQNVRFQSTEKKRVAMALPFQKSYLVDP